MVLRGTTQASREAIRSLVFMANVIHCSQYRHGYSIHHPILTVVGVAEASAATDNCHCSSDRQIRRGNQSMSKTNARHLTYASASTPSTSRRARPRNFADLIRREIPKWRKVLEAAKIQPEG
jgi:hypothetical protein